jgi:hypothetical protein
MMWTNLCKFKVNKFVPKYAARAFEKAMVTGSLNNLAVSFTTI